MEYAETVNPLDEVIEDKGVRILVDPKAVLFLLGTEMDYKVAKLSAQIHLQQSEPDRGLRLRRVGADRAGGRPLGVRFRRAAGLRTLSSSDAFSK